MLMAAAAGCKNGAHGGNPEIPGAAGDPGVVATAKAGEMGPGGGPGYRARNAKVEELRGVWLTNVDSDVLASADTLSAAFANLSALNFTTIYPVVWNGGRTLYPSEVVRAISGEAMDPKNTLARRDIVAESLAAGVRNDIKVVPWST